jgi:putative RNA 2'-phosphotransferase
MLQLSHRQIVTRIYVFCMIVELSYPAAMTEHKKTSKASKQLSWLLRHGAREAGLAMDEAGWVAVDDVLRYLRLSRSALDDLVKTNEKQRLQIEAERIRCCQGHSHGAGVTVEALEASWSVYTDDALIWHGTTFEAVPAIAREGLLPQARTHVHLAPALVSTVGKRAQVALMLGIDPVRVRAAAVTIYTAPNGVILARRIPAACIVELRAMTKKGAAQEAELRRVLFEGRTGLAAQLG